MNSWSFGRLQGCSKVSEKVFWATLYVGKQCAHRFEQVYVDFRLAPKMDFFEELEFLKAPREEDIRGCPNHIRGHGGAKRIFRSFG